MSSPHHLALQSFTAQPEECTTLDSSDDTITVDTCPASTYRDFYQKRKKQRKASRKPKPMRVKCRSSSNPRSALPNTCSPKAVVDLVFSLQLALNKIDSRSRVIQESSLPEAEKHLGEIIRLSDTHHKHHCIPFRISYLGSQITKYVRIVHAKKEYQGWLFNMEVSVVTCVYRVNFVLREDGVSKRTGWLGIYDLKISTNEDSMCKLACI